MANQRIRRSSMENLHLLDLDRWACRQGEGEAPPPPPLPPPRPHLRSSMIEHSRTLYDVTRSQNDPIYARTPMFTTIPRTNQEFHPRQIIGAHVPPEIIRPNSTPSTPQSANKSKDTEADDERTEEEEEEDKKEDSPNKTNRNDDDDDDDRSGSGGGGNDSESSTDSDEKHDDDDDADEILKDDDDDKRSIVEQIFNRDKPK